ncbi:MAG TPA: hypothetical protein VGS01_11535 [Candidatus Limnocylindria bacterium]|nr:hypothetical protein [Candidatus Limnocylindria bacterium]
MGSLARIALLAVVLLAVVLAVRDCTPSRVVFPSPSITQTSSATASPAVSARPSPSASATPSTFALTVTDAELTKAAASSFPQTVSGVTVRDPVVRTTTSNVRLTATARFFFGTTEFVITGTPYASGGRVAVRVDSVTLGGLGLPDSVRASSATAIESAIAQLIPSTVMVQKVTLGEGTVTIEGETRR